MIETMQSAQLFKLAGHEVWVRSIAGVETCVYFLTRGLRVAFDMGVHIPAATVCDSVFLTHGHLDHCGAVHLHVSQRGTQHRMLVVLVRWPMLTPRGVLVCQHACWYRIGMRGMSSPTLYVPTCNAEDVRSLLQVRGWQRVCTCLSMGTDTTCARGSSCAG